LHEIQKKFPTIQCLQIQKPDITDREFELLLAACPNVLEIDLSNCTALTAGLLANAKYPATLEGLYFTGTALNDLGLQAVCKNLPKLKTLVITNCAATTPAARYSAPLPCSIELYTFDKQQGPELNHLIERLLQDAPNHPLVLTNALLLDMQRGQRLIEGKNCLEKLLKTYPNFFDLHMILGGILCISAITLHRFDKEQFEKTLLQAQNHLQTSMQLAPNDQSLLGLAQIAILLQKYREALSLLNKGIKLFPEYQPLNATMANLFLRNGNGFVRNFKEAESCLKKLIAKDARNPEIHFDLAIIYTEGGDGVLPDAKEAKKLAAKALQMHEFTCNQLFIAPNLLMTYAKLGKLILDDPEYKELYAVKIKELFKLLLKEDPKNSELQSFILSTTL
jgi:tetratricopeptide (TPR) repeat protein